MQRNSGSKQKRRMPPAEPQPDHETEEIVETPERPVTHVDEISILETTTEEQISGELQDLSLRDYDEELQLQTFVISKTANTNMKCQSFSK